MPRATLILAVTVVALAAAGCLGNETEQEADRELDTSDQVVPDDEAPTSPDDDERTRDPDGDASRPDPTESDGDHSPATCPPGVDEPGEELCDDRVDNDCDGYVDEGECAPVDGDASPRGGDVIGDDGAEGDGSEGRGEDDPGDDDLAVEYDIYLISADIGEDDCDYLFWSDCEYYAGVVLGGLYEETHEEDGDVPYWDAFLFRAAASELLAHPLHVAVQEADSFLTFDDDDIGECWIDVAEEDLLDGGLVVDCDGIRDVTFEFVPAE